MKILKATYIHYREALLNVCDNFLDFVLGEESGT